MFKLSLLNKFFFFFSKTPPKHTNNVSKAKNLTKSFKSTKFRALLLTLGSSDQNALALN
jgi:hypothetical protein